MSNRWFRFYDEALNDPKVQRLPPHLFKTWVNLLCLSSKNAGKIPCDDDVAFQLRLSVQDAAQQIDDLILAGLVDIDANGARVPHNWHERQYASDSSAERTRKYREKRKKKTCDVTCDGDVTVQNQSQNREENNNYVLSYGRARSDEQGFKSDLLKGRKGKAGGDKFEALRKRAEGFGLPVDELAAQASAKGVRNPQAYFTTLAVNRLREKIPSAAEQLLRDALWGNEGASGLVYAALTMEGA